MSILKQGFKRTFYSLNLVEDKTFIKSLKFQTSLRLD